MISATGRDGVTVSIQVNGTPHSNGSPYSWNTGDNHVAVTASDGGGARIYTVTVTKEV